MKRLRVGVLASGRGTNLQAILDAFAAQDAPAEVAVVISNVAAAQALQRAQRAGVPAEVLEHEKFPDREAFERALAEALERHRVELVCLAGFMRLLGRAFLSRFPGRVINIHPALLPAFPGMHAVRQALEHGVKVAGCTVHFVDEGIDTGPIVAQAAVPVLAGDGEAALAARILAEEHKLYPSVIRLFAAGRVRLEGRRPALERARVVVASACLLGEPCRYDAQGRRSGRVLAALEGKQVVPICPEQLGGLGTPRQPAELRGGDGEAVHRGLARVIASGGQDVTQAFLEGARQAVERARAAGAEAAVLKERSPSCGCRQVTCDGRLIAGQGISTFALAAAGIPALSDEEV